MKVFTSNKYGPNITQRKSFWEKKITVHIMLHSKSYPGHYVWVETKLLPWQCAHISRFGFSKIINTEGSNINLWLLRQFTFLRNLCGLEDFNDISDNLPNTYCSAVESTQSQYTKWIHNVYDASWVGVRELFLFKYHLAILTVYSFGRSSVFAFSHHLSNKVSRGNWS